MTFDVENSVEFCTAVDGEQFGRTNTYGVISGIGCTESGISMDVVVAAGIAMIDADPIVVAGDTVTLVSDPSNTRWNTIVANDDGTVEVLLGDPAPNAQTEPSKPPVAATQVVIKQYKPTAGASVAASIAVAIDKAVPMDVALVEGPQAAHAPGSVAQTTVQLNVNTTMQVGIVEVMHDQIVSSLKFNVTAVGTAGTIGLALFENDGQTKTIDVTTAAISGTGVVTHALSPAVFVKRGLYYTAVNPDGTADVTVTAWTTGADPWDEAAAAGLNEMSGTVTVTAGTIPATFDPDADVTYAASRALVLRLN